CAPAAHTPAMAHAAIQFPMRAKMPASHRPPSNMTRTKGARLPRRPALRGGPMKLGVIGCGKMATALVQGAVDAKVVGAENIVGYGRSAGSRETFAVATGAAVTGSVAELSECDTFLLCTKPNDVAA